MKKAFKLLKDKGLTISFAESMTAGFLSYSLAKYSGASKVFIGSVIAYNESVKNDVLKVDKSVIDKYTLVSKEVSEAMIEGLSKVIDSNIYVSITGNAGPTMEKNTTKKECYISISYNNNIKTINYQFKNNSRIKNINASKKIVTKLIEEIVNTI